MVSQACVSLPAGTTSGALELWPNAHAFPAGHHVALAISAGDFPVFEPDREPQATTILRARSLALPKVSQRGLAAATEMRKGEWSFESNLFGRN